MGVNQRLAARTTASYLRGRPCPYNRRSGRAAHVGTV